MILIIKNTNKIGLCKYINKLAKKCVSKLFLKANYISEMFNDSVCECLFVQYKY